MLKKRGGEIKERQGHHDNNPRVNVVIPALNEEQNLQYVLPHVTTTRKSNQFYTRAIEKFPRSDAPEHYCG